jgi:hypothetical protein
MYRCWTKSECLKCLRGLLRKESDKIVAHLSMSATCSKQRPEFVLGKAWSCFFFLFCSFLQHSIYIKPTRIHYVDFERHCMMSTSVTSILMSLASSDWTW